MKRITALLSVLLIGLQCCQCGVAKNRKDYTGYQVLEVEPKNEENLKYLQHLQLSDDDLYFGSRPASVGSSVQIMVPPQRVSEVTSLFRAAGFEVKVFISNVQSFLDPLLRSMDGEGKRVFDLNHFNILPDINSWMTSLVGQCRSGLSCSVQSLGNSFDVRQVNVFRISKPDAGRRAIYLDATMQSSDWISTSTALHILNALATGSNSDAIRLADSYDWHIIPVVNPDGYVYSYENDRFWLKNRRPVGSCFGVNLNVNFDNRWGAEGSSNSPCNNEFRGSGPASEPETRLIQNELRRLAPTLRAAVSLHAYGSAWSFPFGFTVNYAGQQCSYSSDYNNMMRISNAAADAIQATYGTTWKRGSVCDVVGKVSGTSVDYTKETAGVYNAFALELRGNSFILDTTEIFPAFNEVWNGIVVMVSAIEGP